MAIPMQPVFELSLPSCFSLVPSPLSCLKTGREVRWVCMNCNSNGLYYFFSLVCGSDDRTRLAITLDTLSRCYRTEWRELGCTNPKDQPIVPVRFRVHPFARGKHRPRCCVSPFRSSPFRGEHERTSASICLRFRAAFCADRVRSYIYQVYIYCNIYIYAFAAGLE